MEKELLEMAAAWKQTALEMIQKSENGSRSEMVNRMLYACRSISDVELVYDGPQRPRTAEDDAAKKNWGR